MSSSSPNPCNALLCSSLVNRRPSCRSLEVGASSTASTSDTCSSCLSASSTSSSSPFAVPCSLLSVSGLVEARRARSKLERASGEVAEKKKGSSMMQSPRLLDHRDAESTLWTYSLPITPCYPLFPLEADPVRVDLIVGKWAGALLFRSPNCKAPWLLLPLKSGRLAGGGAGGPPSPSRRAFLLTQVERAISRFVRRSMRGYWGVWCHIRDAPEIVPRGNERTAQLLIVGTMARSKE